MTYGNIEILKLLVSGKIGIEPLDQNHLYQAKSLLTLQKFRELNEYLDENFPQLQGVSYDVRLDEYFAINMDKYSYLFELYTYKGDKNVYDVSLNEFIEFPAHYTEHVEKFFTRDPEGDVWTCIYKDHLVLLPGQRCLASTIEKIGSKSLDITTKMHDKSTSGRQGLIIQTAGFGDPQYCEHWTLEVKNDNPYPVILRKGAVLAQVEFLEVKGCNRVYTSKYNNFGDNRRDLDIDERFKLMLPKPVKVII